MIAKQLNIIMALACMLMFNSCNNKERTALPIYGDESHRIADFRFQDQDGNWITNNTFKDKIYVADFFFTTCPTICPIMSKNMLLVTEHFKGNPAVGIISHSIDPKHDSIPVLKKYAEKLGADTSLWHFVNGSAKEIYALAEKSYFSAAAEEEEAPGGYIHSGGFVLIDQNRQIRGIYDGTVVDSVKKLIQDMDFLLEKHK